MLDSHRRPHEADRRLPFSVSFSCVCEGVCEGVFWYLCIIHTAYAHMYECMFETCTQSHAHACCDACMQWRSVWGCDACSGCGDARFSRVRFSPKRIHICADSQHQEAPPPPPHGHSCAFTHRTQTHSLVHIGTGNATQDQCTHMYIHTYIHMYTFKHTHACTRTHTHTPKHTNTCTQKGTHSWTIDMQCGFFLSPSRHEGVSLVLLMCLMTAVLAFLAPDAGVDQVDALYQICLFGEWSVVKSPPQQGVLTRI